jgi:hypothetical protein
MIVEWILVAIGAGIFLEMERIASACANISWHLKEINDREADDRWRAKNA